MKKSSCTIITFGLLFILGACSQAPAEIATPVAPATRIVEQTSSDNRLKETEAIMVTPPSLIPTPGYVTAPVLVTTTEPNELPKVMYVVRFTKPDPADEIRLIDPLDGTKKTLLHLEDQYIFIARPSPDRQYIAWIGQQYEPYRRSLWLMGPDQEIKQLTPWSEGVMVGIIQWSPDSKQLFVYRYDPQKGPIDVYALSIETQDQVPTWFDHLPFDQIFGVDISPDGRYVSYMDRDDDRLMVQDEFGNSWTIAKLKGGPKEMKWSPDSEWLAYTEAADGALFANTIFISRPNGEGTRKLVSGEPEVHELIWSPSSNYLGFLRSYVSSCYINTMVENAEISCLKMKNSSDDKPLWLSDNEWILSTDSLSDRWDIFRIVLTPETYINVTQDGESAIDLTLWGSN